MSPTCYGTGVMDFGLLYIPPTPRGEISGRLEVRWETCWSTKAAISLKRVKMEDKLLWRPYRNSPTILRTLPSPTPYDLLFLGFCPTLHKARFIQWKKQPCSLLSRLPYDRVVFCPRVAFSVADYPIAFCPVAFCQTDSYMVFINTLEADNCGK